MMYGNPDRTRVDKNRFLERLTSVLEQEAWIIDGNYIRTMETRLRRCDAVFFLDYPTDVCLEGARSRVGTVREDMPWVEEELDAEFRQWIEDFPQEQLPKIYALLEQYKAGKSITIFHSRAEAEAWFRTTGKFFQQKRV